MLVGEVFARMGLDSKQYEKDLDRLENATRRKAITLGDVFKNAFSVTLGMSFFEAVKTGFKSTISAGIGFNSMLQTARIGFSTMLGDAQKAEVFLSQLADFARDTPFEFPELLEASKRMLAYGFAAEEILPTLRAVGDTAAGLGAGKQGIDRITLALGQIRAKGKLSAEEMRQLTEAGVPAWDMLAEAMGKTVPELQNMVSKGLIPGYKAVKMLTAGMNKRFGGMMKQMENTWQGVTSAIADIWNMTIGEISKNLFKRVNEWLIGVKDFAQRFYDALKAGGIQNAIREVFGNEAASAFSIMSAAVKGAWNIVSGFFNFVRSNWNIFGPLVKGALLLYTSFKLVTLATTAAKKAMATFALVQKALAGESLITSGILGLVSKAMGIYRLQMHLAAMQGIVLTGVLAKVRVALYSVWTALGPIGWAILAIAGALGIGITLWNRYTNSLRTATQAISPADLAKGFRDIEKSSQAAADGIGEQTDAMEDANKAASKNIQSFDEVHQLQEDMAGSAEDLTDSMGLDITDLGVPEIGGLEIPDIGAQLEEMKPTLAGFWEWIKQEAGNLWEGVKEKWNSFTSWVSSWGIWTTLKEKWSGIKEWAGNLWDGVKEKWSGFWAWVKSWGLWQWLADRWDGLKERAGNVWEGVKGRWQGFKSWVASWAGPLWDGIKEKWAGFKEWAANMWDGAKEKWGGFTDWVQEKWGNFKDRSGEIWTGVKTNVQTKWEELKTNAPVIWEDIKTSIQTRWENLKTSAGETWNNITTGIKEKWNNLKTNAPTTWENIKTSIQDRWNNLKTNAPTVWENIKKEISNRWEALKTNAPTTWENIRKSINDKWEELKTKAPITWENIKKEISNRWEALKTDAPKTWGEIAGKLADIWGGIKTSASEKWEGVTTVIKGAINGIIGFINKFIRSWNKIELKVPSINIPLVGAVGGWSVRLPRIPEIPMLAKGGLVTDPTLAMLGEAGPEAVVPLGRSGFAGDLADTVAQAVYQAIMDAIRISRASSSQSSDAKEIVLKIDNTVLARMQLPALTREAQRQGFDLVLRPQGV